MVWFDTESGHETQTPAWVHPPRRRSLAPLVLTVVFSMIAGYVLWQVASGLSTSRPSVTIASSGDDVLHQQTVEAGQDETNRLLVMLIDTTLLVNPSPTPSPTKFPTATPRATIATVTCGEWLEDGTICELPKASATRVPSLTPTPIVPCPQTTPSTFSRDYCIWQGGTPTPGYTVGG